MEEPSYAALQREVQRKLGRCLIGIQRYELLLKEFLAKREISGVLSSLPEKLSENVSAVATNTMGQLVGELTKEYFQPASPEPVQYQTAPSPVEAENPEGWFSFRLRVSMTPDAHAQLKTDLQELVDMRNDLVHHFVEGQDLMSDEGCIAADMYLEYCYAEIDRHWVALQDWAASMTEAKQAAASYIASPEYKESLKAELFASQREAALPALIELLRSAESERMNDGWTALSSAIAFIKKKAPEETPRKHSFGSWRQVLSEARIFQVRRGPVELSGATETWYRTRCCLTDSVQPT